MIAIEETERLYRQKETFPSCRVVDNQNSGGIKMNPKFKHRGGIIMLRYYKPRYNIKYLGKDAEVDVVIPMPDCTVRFTYHFIRCKDRIVISKRGGLYSYMVGVRMTTDMSKAIESFLKLDELRYH